MKKRFVFCCFLVGLAFSSSFSQSTVFIVRHAEKADDSKDAELSEAGRARAESVGQHAEGFKNRHHLHDRVQAYAANGGATSQGARPDGHDLAGRKPGCARRKTAHIHRDFVSRRSRQHYPGHNQSAWDNGAG